MHLYKASPVYLLYSASVASDMSKSTESYNSGEEVSDDSIGSSWRYKSKSKPKSRSSGRRKGRTGLFSRYRDDFSM